ncbi:MAG: hypothetical protein KF894_01175 [Labilithrix sp.]|nr:hypothetical protein [Labilithrix sp.]
MFTGLFQVFATNAARQELRWSCNGAVEGGPPTVATEDVVQKEHPIVPSFASALAHAGTQAPFAHPVSGGHSRITSPVHPLRIEWRSREQTDVSQASLACASAPPSSPASACSNDGRSALPHALITPATTTPLQAAAASRPSRLHRQARPVADPVLA